MTEQDKQEPASLADGLANWTPPWARSTEPGPDPDPAHQDPATENAAPDAPAPEPPTPEPPAPEDDEPDSGTAEALEPAAPASPGDAPSDQPAAVHDAYAPAVAVSPGYPMETGQKPYTAADAADPAPPLEEPDDHTDTAAVPDPAELISDQADEQPPDAAAHESSDHDTGTPDEERAELVADTGASEMTPPVEEDHEAEPIDLRGALEAILLVVDEPVSEIVLAEILEQSTEAVGATLRELADEYTSAGRGFDLRRAAGGWRLYTRTEFATYVERFVLDGQQVRLTQAALETLAVVAYKQPVTRPRISAIRGVNCDGVIRTLLTRGLIEECGAEPDSGAHLYRTTALFCEKLGIDSVDDLPPLAPFLPDDLPLDITEMIEGERASARRDVPGTGTKEAAPPDEAGADEAGAEESDAEATSAEEGGATHD